jgi:membrane peptidoglycan carboxypeptidase
LFATLFVTLWQSLPSTSNLEAWVSQQDAAHHVVYVPLSDVAPVMVQALVAAEDEHFFQHHGIDTSALLRAAWDDLRAGSLVEGGSTLTAQLAKNAYLGGHDHTIPLKIQDLMLALKIERNYSKSDILEMYLNLVYFGEGAYGIHAAAQRYFNVSPARLDLAQAALLAGLVQAPGYFDPWCHPHLAQDKQHAVLARMVADGYITSAESAAATREASTFWKPGMTQPADAYCPA